MYGQILEKLSTVFMSRFSKAEILKAEVATQDLFRSESIDLSDYIGRNEE